MYRFLCSIERVIHDDQREAMEDELSLAFSRLLLILNRYTISTEKSDLFLFVFRFTFRKNSHHQKCPSRFDLTLPRRISRLIKIAITNKS